MMRERELGWDSMREWAQTNSGIFVPGDVKAERRLPTGVDLFCGAGGFSCGFHQAGFHVVAASDDTEVCMETYLCNLGGPETLIHFLADDTKRGKHGNRWKAGDVRAAGEVFPAAGTGWISAHREHEVGTCATHMMPGAPGYADRTDDELRPQREAFCEMYHADPPHREPCLHFYLGDVHDLTGEMILTDLGVNEDDIDCVFGGPPCQGFSKANVNAGPHDERNQLVFEFARLVLEIRPKTMAMENVPAIATMLTPEGVPVIDALSRVLADGEFSTYDALRKSLLANVGAGAALARKPRATAVEINDEEDDDEIMQEALF